MGTETWPKTLTSGEHVGQALDWVRWKTQGRAMLLIAIGPNGIVMAKDRELQAEDAIALLQDERETIAQLARALDANRSKTHLGVARRPID